MEGRSQSVPSLTAPVLTARSLPSKVLAPNLKLPDLYPLHTRKLKLGELEKLAQSPEYSIESIQKNEAFAYPLAEFLYHFIEDYFNNMQESRLMVKIKLRPTTDIRLIQSIRGNKDHVFFQLIFKVELKEYD